MSEFKSTQHYRKVANQVKFTWPITLRSTGLDELSGRYAEDVNALCDRVKYQVELLKLCRDCLAEIAQYMGSDWDRDWREVDAEGLLQALLEGAGKEDGDTA